MSLSPTCTGLRPGTRRGQGEPVRKREAAPRKGNGGSRKASDDRDCNGVRSASDICAASSSRRGMASAGFGRCGPPADGRKRAGPAACCWAGEPDLGLVSRFPGVREPGSWTGGRACARARSLRREVWLPGVRTRALVPPRPVRRGEVRGAAGFGQQLPRAPAVAEVARPGRRRAQAGRNRASCTGPAGRRRPAVRRRVRRLRPSHGCLGLRPGRRWPAMSCRGWRTGAPRLLPEDRLRASARRPARWQVDVERRRKVRRSRRAAADGSSGPRRRSHGIERRGREAGSGEGVAGRGLRFGGVPARGAGPSLSLQGAAAALLPRWRAGFGPGGAGWTVRLSRFAPGT
jgi:hypothetical protein